MGWETGELSSLLAPVIQTREQYYDERRDDTTMRPIKRLMLAILEDALCCLLKYANARNRVQRLMYREAEEWVYRDDGDALFSFSMVCETLGIQHEYLRSGLGQWRETQSRSRSTQRIGRRSPVKRVGCISGGIAPRVRGIRDRRVPMQ